MHSISKHTESSRDSIAVSEAVLSVYRRYLVGEVGRDSIGDALALLNLDMVHRSPEAVNRVIIRKLDPLSLLFVFSRSKLAIFSIFDSLCSTGRYMILETGVGLVMEIGEVRDGIIER